MFNVYDVLVKKAAPSGTFVQWLEGKKPTVKKSIDLSDSIKVTELPKNLLGLPPSDKTVMGELIPIDIDKILNWKV